MVSNHTQNGTFGNLTGPAGDGSGGPLSPILDWFGEPEHLVWARIILTALTLVAAYILARLTKGYLERSARTTAEQRRFDEWQTRALISRTKPIVIATRMGLGILAFILLLGVWGLTTGFVSLLTAAGFAGIIIGLAAANSIGNLIAGFMIFYNRPFDIGDWVEIDTVEGIITDVRAGATFLETWDGEKVTFPNRVVEGTRVKNFSHQRKLRRRFAVGVDYATDIAKAREILLDLIKGHPEVLKEPEPMVIGVAFADSSINLEVRYWILPLRASALRIQTWLMQEIQRAFAKEGIVIPFPQRTLVHRFPGADAPEGETISRLAYDPAKDDMPFPAPPLDPPTDVSSTHAKQESKKVFRNFFGAR
ncbi:MAG: mechanosensitive ion channel family protein [Euryarchaeota archaeon]|nr:mechanosensitive ion channel family protein [Euryarchaeota archaeon]